MVSTIVEALHTIVRMRKVSTIVEALRTIVRKVFTNVGALRTFVGPNSLIPG